MNDTFASVTRRSFIAGTASLSGLAATGCVPTAEDAELATPAAPSPHVLMYGSMPNEEFPPPAVDITQVLDRHLRRQVDYSTTEQVGTVIVDTRIFARTPLR